MSINQSNQEDISITVVDIKKDAIHTDERNNFILNLQFAAQATASFFPVRNSEETTKIESAPNAKHIASGKAVDIYVEETIDNFAVLIVRPMQSDEVSSTRPERQAIQTVQEIYDIPKDNILFFPSTKSKKIQIL